MPNPVNKVKQQLAMGSVPVGVVCRTLSPTVVELIGMAGFDFAWLDMEHTASDFGVIEHLCRAADAVGIEALVRVPELTSANVLRALEAGAAIVNVPQVNNRAQTQTAVRAAKFAPAGERGLTPSSRGMHYGFASDGRDPYAAANERVLLMVQIETAEAVRNAQEICSVPDLDAVFIGMADLSQSYGVPGKIDDAQVQDAAHHVIQVARAASQPVMMLVESSESAKSWIAEGVSMLCCGVDVTLFGNLLRDRRESFDILRSRSAGKMAR
jgi:2-keto-3-deoxy-L-rhamnonate aldolase RhmA